MFNPEQDDSRDDWMEWSKYVLKELERLNKVTETIMDRLNGLDIQVGKLEVKASVWGAIAGAVTVGIALLTKLL